MLQNSNINTKVHELGKIDFKKPLFPKKFLFCEMQMKNPTTTKVRKKTKAQNFQNAKLVNVVRMLLSEDNLNLIMGEDVSGRVTVNLDDVSLETALDAILHVNNYEWFIQDNIIIVQPTTTKKIMSGELLTRMFRLDYVAGSIALEAVNEVLTARGKIRAISSTGSTNLEPGEKDILLVTDLPNNFSLIEGDVRSLDVKSDQINISVKKQN